MVQVAIALVAVLLASGVEADVASATTVQSAQQQLAQAQKQLAQLNDQVEKAQSDLDAANRRLAEDVSIRADLDKRVAHYARWEYQQPALPLRLIGAGSLSAALNELRAQAALVVTQAKASAAATGGGNHFAFGYCTWYVASRRYIPWFGNAIQWWPNARAYGYPEGQAPVVGAVMVTRESYLGHVAYVESVNGDGSWTVSEMNYVAWDVVDRRTIFPGQVPLVGFIYNL